MRARANVVDDAARRYYADELALGVERFLLPRVDTCPWCGAGPVRRRTTCRDLRQFKPGRFHLDECCACGHVFQNPALTDAGLAFYYRDAYDGLNTERAEANLASMTELYRARASTLVRARGDAPLRWLDVGTASGHFCAAAAELLPSTTFDGLDISDGVLSAQREGRVQTGYKGHLRELSGELAGRYDQVSMFHYLEHTREPLRELDAVAEILTSDGWVLIEQPDPHARSSRWFGRLWAGWNQPEHLHMVTLSNLLAALESRGFEIVEVVRREAHVPLEAFIVLATGLNRIAPPNDTPWLDRKPSRFPVLRRFIAKAFAAPLVPLARLIDRVLLPRLFHSYHAFRVVARKVHTDAAENLAQAAG